jgi:hypothetical protein
MTTTRIQLSERLMKRAERSAEDKGISFDELIRETLEIHLGEEAFPENDPFLSDREVYEGPTPPDLVERFDDYLYGSED